MDSLQVQIYFHVCLPSRPGARGLLQASASWDGGRAEEREGGLPRRSPVVVAVGSWSARPPPVVWFCVMPPPPLGEGGGPYPPPAFVGGDRGALDGMRSAALDDTISFPGRKRALSTPDHMYIFRFAYVAFF